MFLVTFMSFSKVKLQLCSDIDLNIVGQWANNLPALKRQDAEKRKLLENSLQGKQIIANHYFNKHIYL